MPNLINVIYILLQAIIFMQLKNWWEEELNKLKVIKCQSLNKELSADVLVIGAGIAGLHAALSLIEQGKSVILLEKSMCASSSSGKSSGFLTPDSELELYQLIRRFGLDGAKEVWEIPTKGVQLIVKTAVKYNIDYTLENQDCLFVGLGKSGLEDVKEEVEAHKSMKINHKFYDANELKKIIGTNAYSSGIRTFNTYAISSLLYCNELKKIL